MTRKKRVSNGVGNESWSMDDMAWVIEKLRTPLSKGRTENDQLVIDFPLLQRDETAEEWVVYGVGFTQDIGDYLEPTIQRWDQIETLVREYESEGARLRSLWGLPCFNDARHATMLLRTVTGFFWLETASRYFDAAYQPTNRIAKLTRKALNNRVLKRVQTRIENTKFLTK